MFKKIPSLFLLPVLLAACAARPTSLPPTVTVSPAAAKPTIRTATPQSAATVTAAPVFVTVTSVPTVMFERVEELIQILYVSDPELPQYDPSSIAYAQFPDALEKLAAMGPDAIDAAAHIAKAISFPRQDADRAAETLMSLGPDVTATTIPVLIDHLQRQELKSRLYSLIVLRTVGEKAACAVGDIAPLLWDTDPQVRFASAYAIEEITGKDLLPKYIIDNPDPRLADALLADWPEGKFVQDARDWWTAEGSKINWRPNYGICDP